MTYVVEYGKLEPYLFGDKKLYYKDVDIILNNYKNWGKEELYKRLDELEIEIITFKKLISGKLENEELCALYKKGESIALDMIISKNKKLIYSRCQRYRNMHTHNLEVDDLFQLGSLGVLEAVEKFDIGKKVKFTTYAVHWIDQKIRRGIIDTGYLIRVPINKFDEIAKVRGIVSFLKDETLQDEEIIEILKTDFGYTDLNLRELKKISDHILNPTSTDLIVGDNQTELSELINAYNPNDLLEILDEKLIKDMIYESLYKLDQRQRNIIILRFGLHGEEKKTLEEIGNIYSLTKERIRQIELEALNILKSCENLTLFYTLLMEKL